MLRGFQITRDPSRSLTISSSFVTLGPGEVDAKSFWLRKLAPLLDSDGSTRWSSVLTPHASITPMYIGEIVRRAGISHENLAEARQAIEKLSFSPSERHDLAGLLGLYEGLHVFARSGECTSPKTYSSSGVGLWHGDVLIADPSDPSRLEAAIRRIVLSDFSDDVVAFKERMGLDMETLPGVLLTPAAMQYLHSTDTSSVFAPLYHVNMITKFCDGDGIVILGTGVGGANNRNSVSKLLSRLRPHSFGPVSLLLNREHSRVLVDGKLVLASELDHVGANLQLTHSNFESICAEDAIQGLRRVADALNGQYWVELGTHLPYWVVFQVAPLDLKRIPMPDIPESQKIIRIYPSPNALQYGVDISGNGYVESDHIIFIRDGGDFAKVRELNKSLRNYTIIARCEFREFTKHLSFADYSNAGAIVCLSMSFNNATTHFNGALREAGILVLSSNTIDQLFLSLLHPGDNAVRVGVYANDETQFAFVATL